MLNVNSLSNQLISNQHTQHFTQHPSPELLALHSSTDHIYEQTGKHCFGFISSYYALALEIHLISVQKFKTLVIKAITSFI